MRYYAILVLLAAFAPTLPAWATVDSISACGTSVAKSEAVTVFTGGDSITIKGFLVDTLDRLEITGVTGSATLLGKSSGSIRVGINTARDRTGSSGPSTSDTWSRLRGTMSCISSHGSGPESTRSPSRPFGSLPCRRTGSSSAKSTRSRRMAITQS